MASTVGVCLFFFFMQEMHKNVLLLFTDDLLQPQNTINDHPFHFCDIKHTSHFTSLLSGIIEFKVFNILEIASLNHVLIL